MPEHHEERFLPAEQLDVAADGLLLNRRRENGAGAGMEIVTTVERPDLTPTVADWLWQEFWRQDGYGLAETHAAVAAAARTGPTQTFVALLDGRPAGTASLAAEDLDERPALTPWLAGVFVLPAFRGRGCATRLVAAVEGACRDAAIPHAWLYTRTAEGLYARLGWRAVEIVERQDKTPVTLMRKDF